MIITEYLPSRPHVLWQLSLQMGIHNSIVSAKVEKTGLNPPWEIDSLRQLQKNFSDAGIIIYGLEGDQFDMSRIKLGLNGRDDDIEHFNQMLRNMGELGISLLCYNFMTQIGWFRSKTNITGRGGALVSGFDIKDVPLEKTVAGEVSEEQIWENYTYFIRRVMPVAEKAGVQMALHPDDPPLASLQSIGRIFNTPESFERAYALAPSLSNGVTFCRANFKLMELDISKWIRYFAKQKRLFFVHLRDVHGTAENFKEVFHDEASAELIESLRECHHAGFDGPLRCDHVPTMAGEENDQPGYGTLGRLFADGYILGLMDALGIPHR
jgi:D-mannonate dehydratase